MDSNGQTHGYTKPTAEEQEEAKKKSQQDVSTTDETTSGEKNGNNEEKQEKEEEKKPASVLDMVNLWTWLETYPMDMDRFRGKEVQKKRFTNDMQNVDPDWSDVFKGRRETLDQRSLHNEKKKKAEQQRPAYSGPIPSFKKAPAGTRYYLKEDADGVTHLEEYDPENYEAEEDDAGTKRNVPPGRRFYLQRENDGDGEIVYLQEEYKYHLAML